jgi:HSP20 family protein
VRTAREQGNVRPAAAGQQRANAARQPTDFLSSMPGSVVGSTPFAMMRRMMDDMDRLFSDYGFTHPGILASSLLSPEMWGTQRGLGRGTPAGSSVSPAQSVGQQNLQRGGQRGLQQSGARGLWAPHVEVFERGNNIVVRADLPGLTRDDIDVEVDDDALIIRGERHSDVEDEQEGYYRSERSYGSFYRAIPLPENIDHNACNASFKDGVLEVTLPKPAQQQSRAKRIDVR